MQKMVFLLLVIFGSRFTQIFGLPGQVVIVNRPEMDTTTFTLSTKGLERASALAYFLTETPSLLNFGPPVALFAARQVLRRHHETVLMIQAATPTSDKLSLPIHLGYSELDSIDLVDFILNYPLYDGKNVLIFWHQSDVSFLLQAFGFAPLHNNRTDIVYVLNFPATGQQATRVLQELLLNDPTTLPPY